MWRTVLTFGAILAATSLVLQWLQYRVLAWSHPGEIYLFPLALGFMGMVELAGGRPKIPR